MTHDGLGLETIRIDVTKMGKKLRGSERVYQPDMLPHEIADLTLSLFEAIDERNEFQVESVERFRIAGLDGFKAEASFKAETGLCKRLRIYGVEVEGYLCEFRYVAADKVYFTKYLPDFERMVASARIRR
jgi:hypothetical protein